MTRLRRFLDDSDLVREVSISKRGAEFYFEILVTLVEFSEEDLNPTGVLFPLEILGIGFRISVRLVQ